MSMKRIIIISLLLIIVAVFAGCNESQKITVSPTETTPPVIETVVGTVIADEENVTSYTLASTEVQPQESFSSLATEPAKLPSESVEASTEATEVIYEEPQINFSDLE